MTSCVLKCVINCVMEFGYQCHYAVYDKVEYVVLPGLNCAEAVNFATADWLPHGGFGAELYRLYRKPAVISHDELLCVVAKVERATIGKTS